MESLCQESPIDTGKRKIHEVEQTCSSVCYKLGFKIGNVRKELGQIGMSWELSAITSLFSLSDFSVGSRLRVKEHLLR